MVFLFFFHIGFVTNSVRMEAGVYYCHKCDYKYISQDVTWVENLGDKMNDDPAAREMIRDELCVSGNYKKL